MKYVLFNGGLHEAHLPLLPASNRGFRYGDGLFETMKVEKGEIRLATYHFERLFSGMDLLEIKKGGLNREGLIAGIKELALQNNCHEYGRVRLAVYRTEENESGYLAEAFPLPVDAGKWNEKGWRVGVHPYVRKSMDAYALLKSANFLPYVLAGRFAEAEGWDECLVLNGANRLCDGSKTNIFLVTDREISTPALHEGCVNGVMRRFVIEGLKRLGYAVKQTELTVEELEGAHEVFVTNAVRGLKWVSHFKCKEYSNNETARIYTQLFG